MPPPHPSRGRPGSKPTDSSKSNERNEYIPSFIAKKPFYIDDATATDSDYLEHQRLQSQKNHDPLATAAWYDRGAKKGPAATKYRKGACENCGSMSHVAKDCLQRKRKHGAKWTGKDIAADEEVQEVKLGWDAKRDRWNGFSAEDYGKVIEEYEELEEMKRQIADRRNEGSATKNEDDDEGEGAKYEEETDMGRQQSKSTRNLRLREDTAKYLVNLDLDSARYDPKTRSMLDPDAAALTAAGENNEGEGKSAGGDDAAEFERAQHYAWETQERGNASERIHLQANPTEALLKRKRKAEEDTAKKDAKKKLLIDKYGSQDAVERKTLGGAGAGVGSSNEKYVEYDRHGRVKGGEPRRSEKSMYAEDLVVNNHTSVWGSWWRDFAWGYACCHSTVKNSFCTGEKGRLAVEAAERRSKGLIPSAEDAENSEVVDKEEAWKEEAEGEKHVPNAGDGPVKSNADESSRRRLEELSGGGGGVTEAEMERYRRERMGRDDPMAKILGRDELVGG